MDKLPISIHTDYPILGSVFDKIGNGYFFDDGTYNIPSQLHGLSDEMIGILVFGRLIHILIVEDPETHYLYTNEEDIRILQNYVNSENNFYDRVVKNNILVTRSIIEYNSENKDMMKTFWKDYYNHNLK